MNAQQSITDMVVLWTGILTASVQQAVPDSLVNGAEGASETTNAIATPPNLTQLVKAVLDRSSLQDARCALYETQACGYGMPVIALYCHHSFLP